MTSNVSILLVDDHPVFRNGIANLFTRFPCYYVMEAADGNEAIQLSDRWDFNLIMMDESMPGLNGYDAAKVILQKKPATKIVALTQYDDMPLILNFLRLGLRGYVNKSVNPDELVDAVLQVLAGKYYFHSKYDAQIATWLERDNNAGLPHIRFSKREIQIIVLISKGYKNEMIATELGIGVRTVEAYRFDLLRKTGLKNSSQLISYVYQNAVVSV